MAKRHFPHKIEVQTGDWLIKMKIRRLPYGNADYHTGNRNKEAALAHILNAEGEKMQTIICMKEISTKELFELNCSVRKLLEAVTCLENILQGKLEFAICGEKKSHKKETFDEMVPEYTL